MEIGENISSDTRVIANALNSFFGGTAHRLLHSLSEVAYNIAKRNGDSIQILQRPLLKFQKVSKNSVLCQLQRLKTSKAVGLNDIPSQLLKNAAHIVATPLTDIIDASLNQAKVPVDWKAARVIRCSRKVMSAIWTITDLSILLNLANYRPINLAHCLEAVGERGTYTACQLPSRAQAFKSISMRF